MIMAQDANNLIWLDMEMSGLDPDRDRILEVAIVVTNSSLDIVAEGPVRVVHQSDAVLDGMDSWNKGTHGKSGLIDRVKASRLAEADVETELAAWLAQHVPANASPMCGNSICQDRRFLARYMPGEALEAGDRRRLCQARQARGAGRHPRVHRGAQVLPGALPKIVGAGRLVPARCEGADYPKALNAEDAVDAEERPEQSKGLVFPRVPRVTSFCSVGGYPS
jgi:hypothetical protein